MATGRIVLIDKRKDYYYNGSGLCDNREFYYVIVDDDDIRIEFEKGCHANSNELSDVKEYVKRNALPKRSWNHANPVESAVALS